VGERVTIELVAMDVVHGLFVDGYEVSTTAEPGRPGRLTFVAHRTGAFRLRCSVTCGSLHPFVAGVLKVGPQTLLWRAAALAVIAALGGLWLARR
jgi:heme/copper-type cytochrome/quinol oxidase subunit 2